MEMNVSLAGSEPPKIGGPSSAPMARRGLSMTEILELAAQQGLDRVYSSKVRTWAVYCELIGRRVETWPKDSGAEHPRSEYSEGDIREAVEELKRRRRVGLTMKQVLALAQEYGVKISATTVERWGKSGRIRVWPDADDKNLLYSKRQIIDEFERLRSASRKLPDGSARGDQLRFTDELGRDCIAMTRLAEVYGIAPHTYRGWHENGCGILGGEKPEIWEERKADGHPRQFVFVGFIERYQKERRKLEAKPTKLSKIPRGWRSWKRARTMGLSEWELSELVKTHPEDTDHVIRASRNGVNTRVRIFRTAALKRRLSESRHNPNRFNYPGLIAAWKVKTTPDMIRAPIRSGAIEPSKRPGLDRLGRVLLKLLHLKVADARKLEERYALWVKTEGTLRRDIRGKDTYFNHQALLIANDGVAKDEQISAGYLWFWRPKEFGGCGKPCPHLPGRPSLTCFPDEGGYRTKLGSENYRYTGDDMRWINAGLRGWPEPVAGPDVPGEFRSKSLNKRQRHKRGRGQRDAVRAQREKIVAEGRAAMQAGPYPERGNLLAAYCQDVGIKVKTYHRWADAVKKAENRKQKKLTAAPIA